MRIREGVKTTVKNSQADRFRGAGGSPPPSLATSICENFDPFFSYIQRQNNLKYDNLSRIFYNYRTASGEGEGGVNPSGQPGRFFSFFFWRLPYGNTYHKNKLPELFPPPPPPPPPPPSFGQLVRSKEDNDDPIVSHRGDNNHPASFTFWSFRDKGPRRNTLIHKNLMDLFSFDCKYEGCTKV